MITALLLAIMLVALAGMGVFLTVVFGGTFFVLFGDLIIFVLIILGIIKLCEKK